MRVLQKALGYSVDTICKLIFNDIRSDGMFKISINQRAQSYL